LVLPGGHSRGASRNLSRLHPQRQGASVVPTGDTATARVARAGEGAIGRHVMSTRVELRAFYGVVGLLLLTPLVGGLLGEFGGVEGMARRLGVDGPIVISPLLQNNFRAVCCAFFSWVPLVIWSLAAIPERAGAFRIVVRCGFLTALARLTGYLVDGYPGF